MRHETVMACVAVLALAACGNNQGTGSGATQGAADAAAAPAPDATASPEVPRPIELPPTSAAPTEPTAAGAATPDGGAATAPAAAGAATCAGGTSEDPIPPLLHPPRGLSLPVGQTELMRLKALMPQYPRSATLRVVAAGEALKAGPQRDPVEAQRLFQEALQLHEGGCRLTEGNEWQALQGLGNSYMMQENYAEALPVFQRIVGRWPNIAQSQYNLACAQCRSGQLEPCHEAFSRALQIAASNQQPPFIRDSRSAGDYARLSRGDRDLVSLREDSRYQGLVAPHMTTE